MLKYLSKAVELSSIVSCLFASYLANIALYMRNVDRIDLATNNQIFGQIEISQCIIVSTNHKSTQPSSFDSRIRVESFCGLRNDAWLLSGGY